MVRIYPDKTGTGTEVDIAGPMDADADPVKTAELYYAIARKCGKTGETMKIAIIAGIVTAVVALAGAGATAVMAQVVPQVQPIQPGVTGAWTNFTLHLPGKKQNGTIDASGALLSGAGTFVPTQIPGSGEPVLDVGILGCTFTVVVSGAQDNNHGSYLLFAGDEPANACAGLNGSGDWRINAAGTIVTAQGPVTIFRPKPAPSETITPPPSTTTQPPALGRTRLLPDRPDHHRRAAAARLPRRPDRRPQPVAALRVRGHPPRLPPRRGVSPADESCPPTSSGLRWNVTAPGWRSRDRCGPSG
jgi:hypothetical protein